MSGRPPRARRDGARPRRRAGVRGRRRNLSEPSGPTPPRGRAARPTPPLALSPRDRAARPTPPRSPRPAPPLGRFVGRIYRQTALRVPACAPPAERAPHGGRYHGPGDPWPLYGTLDEATIWAEWAHATGGAVRPEDDPRWRCVFEADLAVLDLRDEATQASLGVTVDDLVAPWSPDRPNRACRRVMEAALAAGADAIIVPSAALPGGWSIDVLPRAFGRLRLVSREQVVPTPPAKGPA